ncbi:hypothetical protein DFQ00_107143 [Paenibacillus barcinonensis]|uniref:Uncharacterized protein n=3 Tax=Paenibacillus barcinonensis TaxID=198119 RepID=A0A2V4W2Y9_PAEBA|nr:hypothetical protein DFQ00_107143 [Paenibacillus barcinonensis]
MAFSRNHKKLNVSNFCPMDLNFLLYMENIYECYNQEKEIFPGKSLISNHRELLEYDSFKENLNLCWDAIVKEYEQHQFKDNPLGNIHFRDEYNSLLRRDSDPHTFETVWNAFSLWWWSEFGVKTYMERYSDLFIPDLAEQIWEGLYDRHIEVDDDSSLYVMLLFKQPVMIIPKSSNKLYFSSINDFVHKKEEIVCNVIDLFA